MCTRTHTRNTYNVCTIFTTTPNNHLRACLLMQDPDFKVIVFFPTARMTQLYSEVFIKLGMPVLEMHSRKSQVRGHASVGTGVGCGTVGAGGCRCECGQPPPPQLLIFTYVEVEWVGQVVWG